jgi:hypothetical protein
MTKIQMKPETIERRTRERAARQLLNRYIRIGRLQQKAKDDPHGPWAELLAIETQAA